MTSAAERVSHFFEGARRHRGEIVSPEGVALTVEVAGYAERVVAFVLDFFFWTCATAALWLLLVLSLGGLRQAGVVALSLGLFLSFLIRNLYLIHFELAWRGATPGKRLVGLRVVDRRGGPLEPGAVIARNLTREIEFFFPLGLLAAAGVGQGASAWTMLCLGLWMLSFTLLPLFSRQRLRAGDLIAGTLVVALPRRLLLEDLAERPTRYAFADTHLTAYGAFELQVLEELLRRAAGLGAERLRRDVCDKICRKIGWTQPVPEADTDRFLRDFYAAERAFLEREQLFGRPTAGKGARQDPKP